MLPVPIKANLVLNGMIQRFIKITMNNVTIATGFSPEGYKLYGKNCIQSILKFWPKDVHILIYLESYKHVVTYGTKDDRIKHVLISEIDSLNKFLEYAKDKPEANGTGRISKWKEKEIKAGYSYRFDAYKFCKMAFYARDAANRCDTEYLIWLDGDTVTFNDVPDSFIENLMPKKKICAYLGRGKKHSECGFILFRLPEALQICNQYAEYYQSLNVFSLKEWHSSFVFDTVISSVDQKLLHNMTPSGRGHVWFQSPLCRYIDHLKGNRKHIGYSKERFK